MASKTKVRTPRHYIHSNSPVGMVRAHFEDLHHPSCTNEVHFTPAQARSMALRLMRAANETDALTPPNPEGDSLRPLQIPAGTDR